MASKEINRLTSDCCLTQLTKVQSPVKLVLFGADCGRRGGRTCFE